MKNPLMNVNFVTEDWNQFEPGLCCLICRSRWSWYSNVDVGIGARCAYGKPAVVEGKNAE